MKKIRVLQVQDYPPFEGGGLEINTFRVSKALEKYGVKAKIATGRFTSETYNSLGGMGEIVKNGILACKVTSPDQLSSLILDSDIVDIQFTFSCRPVAMEAMRLCSEIGKDFIVTVHTLAEHIPFSAIGELSEFEKRSKLDELVGYLSCEKAIICGVSRATLETLSEVGVSNKKVKIINYGTAYETFEEEGLNSHEIDTVDLTYVGEISYLKGINYLLDAMRNLKSKYKSIRLRLIGGGADFQDMQRLTEVLDLRENVLFEGYVEHGVVGQYLKKTKLYVQPSLSESWCMSLAEAIVMKVPSIATDAGGMVELTADGEFAEIVPKADASNLAKAIEKAISDNEFYEKLGAKAACGSEFIRNTYTLENQAKEKLNLYKKLL
ncbi:glycosyltransferase [Candidatus Dojkabacteria bacterium]|nr:glycosyltransferase [Candidatus Dojkabacteria bacterium]